MKKTLLSLTLLLTNCATLSGAQPYEGHPNENVGVVTTTRTHMMQVAGHSRPNLVKQNLIIVTNPLPMGVRAVLDCASGPYEVDVPAKSMIEILARRDNDFCVKVLRVE